MRRRPPPALDLRARLLELVPDPARVSVSASVLEQHGQDLTYHEPRLPDVVVFPRHAAEVSAVLRFASSHGVAVVPFGVGTSVEGHVIPLESGISLDLSQMNRIVAVAPADFTAVVEPGVLRSQLNKAVNREGLHFPVDPGADATLGGMAATNASGTTTVRYGGMREHVLGLEVVLAGGTVVRTGSRARKSSAGYDLTGLFVGSEGTLGVITELILRLQAIPEYVLAARAVFPSVEAACRAATGIVSAGLAITRVELVDEPTIRAVNAYKQTSYPEAPTLFLEFAGSRASVDGDVELARELAAAEGCTSIDFESETEARSRLWEARHHAALAIMAAEPGKRVLTTDVCVPVSMLADAVHDARQAIEEAGVEAAILGHVGDGNYHAVFMVDPGDPAEIARADEVNDRIVRDALVRGGTCTGEHGIGMGKISYLEQEHATALPLMRGIKQLLDPANVMNPGKILPREAVRPFAE